jgi:hypothetical protein
MKQDTQMVVSASIDEVKCRGANPEDSELPLLAAPRN